MATAPEIVAEFFELTDPPPLKPRYNIAPTQPAPVVRIRPGGTSREFDHLHWGLIPGWAKDPSIGNRMINARSETVTAKPAFRNAFRNRRCLVVADGFYEWKKTGTRKQPYVIRMCDGSPFAFAGLWEHWESAEGEAIDSCALLTTQPNELVGEVHDRMPVILRPSDFDLWLDPSMNKPEKLEPLLRAYPANKMTTFAVSTRVNSPTRDDPACIEPA